jgi:hypothetical protein
MNELYDAEVVISAVFIVRFSRSFFFVTYLVRSMSTKKSRVPLLLTITITVKKIKRRRDTLSDKRIFS